MITPLERTRLYRYASRHVASVHVSPGPHVALIDIHRVVCCAFTLALRVVCLSTCCHVRSATVRWLRCLTLTALRVSSGSNGRGNWKMYPASIVQQSSAQRLRRNNIQVAPTTAETYYTQREPLEVTYRGHPVRASPAGHAQTRAPQSP